MAELLTRGYSFGATELVTNDKLHTLVDDADVALDTDNTLAADSDEKIPSQKAVKYYVDNSPFGITMGKAIAAAIVFG